MKITKIVTVFVALGMSALPMISLASTYQFVDSGGRLQSVEANSASEALAKAPNIGAHSGVMLVSASTGTVLGSYYVTPSSLSSGDNNNYYQFVDINGNLRGVWASNPTEAFALAQQIGTHSGVMLTNTR